ncbi:hypothetical protein J4216_06545 [Candidatus Woesearchaeota archaeon]|nr:hypothetical protein [Candidatus Woesearchaeota archaeon]
MIRIRSNKSLESELKTICSVIDLQPGAALGHVNEIRVYRNGENSIVSPNYPGRTDSKRGIINLLELIDSTDDCYAEFTQCVAHELKHPLAYRLMGSPKTREEWYKICDRSNYVGKHGTYLFRNIPHEGGFINRYSRSLPEEDQAELFGTADAVCVFGESMSSLVFRDSELYQPEFMEKLLYGLRYGLISQGVLDQIIRKKDQNKIFRELNPDFPKRVEREFTEPPMIKDFCETKRDYYISFYPYHYVTGRVKPLILVVFKPKKLQDGRFFGTYAGTGVLTYINGYQFQKKETDKDYPQGIEISSNPMLADFENKGYLIEDKIVAGLLIQCTSYPRGSNLNVLRVS